jgi:eukaryotic-like serine/threonine-protein kinase
VKLGEPRSPGPRLERWAASLCGSWFRIVVLLAALLALGLFALAIVTLVRHGGAARSTGWTDAPENGSWIIARVDPAGPAAEVLRVGDRLVSLDGDTLVARHGPRHFLRWLPIGRSYTLRVEREGRELEYTLTVAPGQRTLGKRLVLLATSLVWCLVGLFIGYAKPGDTAARIAFAAAVSTALVYLQTGVLPGVWPGTSFQPLHMILGYHFFFRFPGGVRRGRLSRSLLFVFYAWGVASWGLRQSVNWAYVMGGAGADAAWAAQVGTVLRLRGLVDLTLMLPLVIGTVALVWSAYRNLSDPDQRRRIRWIAFAAVVGLSPLLLWAVLQMISDLASPAPSPVPRRLWGAVNVATNAGTALIPIGVAYAVVKHRVFDIVVVVRRTVRYLLAKRALQVLLALPTAALLVTFVIQRDQTIAQVLSESTAYLWFMGAAALSLRFRRPLGRWLDRRFFREQYDREQVLMGLLADLRQLSDPEDVSHLVRAQVEYAFHPDTLRLWFDGEPEPPPEPLLEAIAREGEGPDAPIQDSPHLPEGIRVALPLMQSDERLTGVFMLGEKRSEEPYSPQDLSLLAAIAKQAGVVRENLLLRRHISEERRIRTDVLAHLGPDRVNLLKECPVCGTCYDSEAERCARDGQALGLSVPVSRTVAGRYRLDALIGKGGMGAVYEALDLRLDRIVAVKLLLDRAFDQEHALRRFRRTARALARLSHPNIVSVYDYGALEAHGAFLVMERIRGLTLREELEWRGALAGAAAAEWFGQMLDGVAAAHEEGIIHRDLKPENVVRQRTEHGPPVVKILDFGIARVRPIETAGDRLTETGTVLGTLGYMSPEQLLGHEVDTRSDLFSVGVMVVEALTGRWPFHGTTYGELLAAIVLEPYHLPGTAPQLRALDALLQRCLAKEPRDRFASAAALGEELIPALRECPDLPRAPAAPPVS